MWEELAPELAQAAGTCSYFNSSADFFQNNQATIAGAVIYSTNATSTAVYCQSTSSPVGHEDCPEWGQAASNALGAMGNGPGLALPAASILLDENPDYNASLAYISDGISQLPLPTVTVLDLANHSVVLSGLTANLTLLSNTAPGSASLSSQMQESNNAGNITFSSVALLAAPGLWRLQVELSSYPEVSHKSAYAELCGITCKQASFTMPFLGSYPVASAPISQLLSKVFTSPWLADMHEQCFSCGCACISGLLY